jgi:hypothetical protein
MDFDKIRHKFFFLENLSRISTCHWNLTRIKGTLHKDVFTFITISRWIILRMRNGLDKICRENKNTHFMFNNFFPKIVPFMRCREIWWKLRGHKWQYGACVLHAGYDHTHAHMHTLTRPDANARAHRSDQSNHNRKYTCRMLLQTVAQLTCCILLQTVALVHIHDFTIRSRVYTQELANRKRKSICRIFVSNKSVASQTQWTHAVL